MQAFPFGNNVGKQYPQRFSNKYSLTGRPYSGYFSLNFSKDLFKSVCTLFSEFSSPLNVSLSVSYNFGGGLF